MASAICDSKESELWVYPLPKPIQRLLDLPVCLLQSAVCPVSSACSQPLQSATPGLIISSTVLVGLQVAAFLLDHQRFSGVPPTALVSCSGFEAETCHAGESAQAIKVGSLQAYVTADSDCEERGSSSFPVQQASRPS